MRPLAVRPRKLYAVATKLCGATATNPASLIASSAFVSLRIVEFTIGSAARGEAQKAKELKSRAAIKAVLPPKRDFIIRVSCPG
jgi:hypothetical protein